MARESRWDAPQTWFTWPTPALELGIEGDRSPMGAGQRTSVDSRS
ncbi:MAG TPA: hypothetical protein V6D20_03620 [Candidatus Obscuribacterales bacterium]